MKRITLLFCLMAMTAASALAQDNVYNINIGDTLVLQPFQQCSRISFNLSSKEYIRFTPLHYGEKIQVIGLKPGTTKLTASCNDVPVTMSITVNDPNVQAPAPKAPLVKPETLPFAGEYRFTPPTDHFFITVATPGEGYRETYAKIGPEEAFCDGRDTDRFWNTKTGANWFYVPSAQGWTDDVKWEFEAFGESFFPLNAFAREVNTDDLSQYYTGMDKVLNIDCWTFFVEQADGHVVRYWVDPANGCTLRRQIDEDDPYEVNVYNLNFKQWFFGPHFKKSLHDKTR
jgi:hypothetical protein